MKRLAAPTIVLVAFLTGIIGPGRCASAAESTEPGVLVLRNGSVLEGKVTRAEDGYVVVLPNGQIRVKEADVDVVCKDLADGYQRKRAAIQVGNVHHHLELAQWCLRHGLTGYAATELADAKTADPKNPMIRVLETRLKLATEPPDDSHHKTPAPAGPSNEDLDKMVRSLPRGTAEYFTQAVQPVLMNHCLGSGCHSSPEVPMPLMRVNLGRAVSRRSTQRNLNSVLKYVDRANPLESKLLNAPLAAHGSLQHAIFNEKDAAQYKRLVDWARIVAQQPADTPTVEPQSPAMDEFGEPEVRRGPRVLSPDARRAQPMPGVPPKHGSRSADEAAKGEPRPMPHADAPNNSADPLDPEAFNRRYAPKKPAASEKPASSEK